MKHALVKAIAAAVLGFATVAENASADPIQGTIDFAGTVVLNSSMLSSATQVESWTTVVNTSNAANVAGPLLGDFAPFVSAGSPVTVLAPYILGESKIGLISFGGFTFDLADSSFVNTPGFLNISGSGTVYGNGFDATPATWLMTVPGIFNPMEKFAFAATLTAQAVPEGGMSIVLLGCAVACIFVVRRNFRVTA